MNGTIITGSHRRLGLRIIALVTTLVPLLLPQPSSAFGMLRLQMANASAPVTIAGRTFEIRLEVGTTCSPVIGTNIGSCSNIAVSVTYWNTTGAPATVNDTISWLGGIAVVRVPAHMVRPAALHFRSTARQTWTPVACGDPELLDCTKQSASASQTGRAVVLEL